MNWINRVKNFFATSPRHPPPSYSTRRPLLPRQIYTLPAHPASVISSYNPLVQVGHLIPRSSRRTSSTGLGEVEVEERFDSPMNKKNISKPSSRIDAFNVLPKICNPFECLDNLNIRNTRTKRITRSMANDMAWFVDLSCNKGDWRFISAVPSNLVHFAPYLWTDWCTRQVQRVLLLGNNGCQRNEIRNDGDYVDYIHDVPAEIQLIRTSKESER